MHAICKVEAGEGGIALREIESRAPGPGELRLKVAAAGICGTDMQIYKWAPRMARRMALPRALGHEMSGTVESAGAGVTAFAPGQRVVLESHIFCDACTPCRKGRRHLCANTKYPGIDIEGAFADYITVPESIVWALPDGISMETGAMMEPFGIAVHACEEGSGVAGQSVLVNGCGPIGLMAVAAARALGATTIVACDLNPLRLKTAATMGADIAVDPRDRPLADIVRDATGGDGVDVGIEFSGSEAGFNAVFDSLAKGGDFRLVGAPPTAIPVDFTYWLLKCPRMVNIHGRRVWETWETSTDLLLTGKVDLTPVNSHTLPLEDGVRGFELILAGEAVKPLLIPG